MGELINIPRRDLQQFRAWLVNQPEFSSLTNTFIRHDEQEKVLMELYKKFLEQKEIL